MQAKILPWEILDTYRLIPWEPPVDVDFLNVVAEFASHALERDDSHVSTTDLVRMLKHTAEGGGRRACDTATMDFLRNLRWDYEGQPRTSVSEAERMEKVFLLFKDLQHCFDSLIEEVQKSDKNELLEVKATDIVERHFSTFLQTVRLASWLCPNSRCSGKRVLGAHEALRGHREGTSQGLLARVHGTKRPASISCGS